MLVLFLAKVYTDFGIPRRILSQTISILSKNGNIGNKIVVGCQSFLITKFKVLGVAVLN